MLYAPGLDPFLGDMPKNAEYFEGPRDVPSWPLVPGCGRPFPCQKRRGSIEACSEADLDHGDQSEHLIDASNNVSFEHNWEGQDATMLLYAPGELSLLEELA